MSQGPRRVRERLLAHSSSPAARQVASGLSEQGVFLLKTRSCLSICVQITLLLQFRPKLCKLLLEHHLVPYGTNSVHSDLHHVAILQETLGLHEQAYPARRAGLDDSALAQRGAAAQVRDDLGDAEDHVRRLGLLPHLAVDLGDVVEFLGVGDEAGCHDAGADGGELVEGLCVAKLNTSRVKDSRTEVEAGKDLTWPPLAFGSWKLRADTSFPTV